MRLALCSSRDPKTDLWSDCRKQENNHSKFK